MDGDKRKPGGLWEAAGPVSRRIMSGLFAQHVRGLCRAGANTEGAFAVGERRVLFKGSQRVFHDTETSNRLAKSRGRLRMSGNSNKCGQNALIRGIFPGRCGQKSTVCPIVTRTARWECVRLNGQLCQTFPKLLGPTSHITQSAVQLFQTFQRQCGCTG